MHVSHRRPLPIAVLGLFVLAGFESPKAPRHGKDGPELVFSSYLGGNSFDSADRIALDTEGNVYVLGWTLSSDFPGSPPLPPGDGPPRSFLTKLDPSGAIAYSRFVSFYPTDIAIDRTGAAYLVGISNSRSTSETVVSKLTTSGEVAYSVSLGSSSGAAIAVDAAGNVVVTGLAFSADFPATNAIQPVFGGTQDAYLAKLDHEGRVLYATYLGGRGFDTGLDVAMDGAGNAYVLGRTHSDDFPTTRRAFQPMIGGAQDAFVTKISATGSDLVYSSYFGGGGDEWPASLAVDRFGGVSFTGYAWREGLPTKHPLQAACAALTCPFVAKIEPDGSSLTYSTYLGTATDDVELVGESGSAIAVDAEGNAYVTGWTSSNDFPIVRAFQPNNASGPAFRTRDGGRTWQLASSGLAAGTISNFAFAPRVPGLIYAATDRGLFRTSDGGGSWRVSQNQVPMLDGISRVVVDPLSPSIVYAGTRHGVFKSLDGGDSWTAVNSGLPTSFESSALAVHALAIAPSNPSTLYAAVDAGVFRTDNAGSAWTRVLEKSCAALAVDPQNPAHVYLALDGVLKSDDGGSTWTEPRRNANGVRDIQIDPRTPSTLYAGPSFWKSTDRGVDWSPVETSSGFSVGEFSIDPSAPATLYAGDANGFGFRKSTDSGNTWTTLAPLSSSSMDLTAISVDPASPNRIYVGTRRRADLFVAKINPSGSTLLYATYLGGRGNDLPAGIATDGRGNVYIVGGTESSDFPVVGGFQSALAGRSDAFIARIADTAARSSTRAR